MNSKLLGSILALEWEMTRQVNEEARVKTSDDDKAVFAVMRYSQIEGWSEDLLESIRSDLAFAWRMGRNLAMERSAHMLETTSPQDYAQLASRLPKLDEASISLIEDIVEIFVAWREQTIESLPELASFAEAIHTSDDWPDRISFETTLRSELRTYSPETLKLFRDMAVENKEQGVNLDTGHLLRAKERMKDKNH